MIKSLINLNDRSLLLDAVVDFNMLAKYGNFDANVSTGLFFIETQCSAEPHVMLMRHLVKTYYW